MFNIICGIVIGYCLARIVIILTEEEYVEYEQEDKIDGAVLAQIEITASNGESFYLTVTQGETKETMPEEN